MATTVRSGLDAELLTLLPDTGKVITPADHRLANKKMLDFIGGSKSFATPLPSNFLGMVAPGFSPPGDLRLRSTVLASDSSAITTPSGTWLPDGPNTTYYGGRSLYTTSGPGVVKMKSYYGIGFTYIAQTNSGRGDLEVWDNGAYVQDLVCHTATDQAYHVIATVALPEGVHNVEFRTKSNTENRNVYLFNAVLLTPSPNPVYNTPAGGPVPGIFGYNPLDFPGVSFSDRYELAVAAALAPGGCQAVVVTESNAVADRTMNFHSNLKLTMASMVTLGPNTLDNIGRSANMADPTNIPTAPVTNFKLYCILNGGFRGADTGFGGDNSPLLPNNEKWRSIGLAFANTTHSEFHNLYIEDSNCWGICFEQCRYIKLFNPRFNQRGLVGNTDGIDLRQGTHHVDIYGYSGRCFDDAIAMTNIKNYPQNDMLKGVIYEPGVTSLDIHAIRIFGGGTEFTAKILNGSPAREHYWGGILMLACDGLKIYDVVIKGLTGIQQINVGYTANSYGTPAEPGDISDIHIEDCGQMPVYINSPVSKSSFIGIAETDVTGQYPAGVLFSGSTDVVRQYKGKAQEVIVSVP